MSANLSMLNTPPFDGTGFFTPYTIMIYTAPSIIATMDMNLATMIKNCKALVFSIDLKLKAAPDKKKRASHRVYSLRI